MNLLFDLGGVIMDIDRLRCVEAYRRLGMVRPEDFLGNYAQKGPFMLIESGAISADDFRSEMRKFLPAGVTDSQIDYAFFEFLVGIPRHRLEELRILRKLHKVYLLSNTNPIMWDGKIADEFRQEGLEREDYFDGMVTSFEAKSMKPDRRIFDYAIEKLGIDPTETLFFDDSQANLDAAARLGFMTALVPPGTEFIDILVQR